MNEPSSLDLNPINPGIEPSTPVDLLTPLKEVFGYTSFRPLQEEIMRDSLSGRDVLALLPTGGGKSLCFQLPALARRGLTVVISPLIALMKDQVDQLVANGVAATFLNSSLAPDDSRRRLRGLHQGEFKLLYLAPERLLLSGTLEDLARWDVRLIAVDEAHCISEWGHDFRPEYRQLAELRPKFPGVPFMALTATATRRVREDIVRQLHLKDPKIYTASFNRPNLSYRVVPKAGAYDQIRDFIKTRPRESGIIYCASRAATESLANRLLADRIKAAPYHAGLDGGDRARNQEAFLRDEVRVICATIAFGMGINKPNVRYVLHHDLPKNLEGYYQETGRAGRDGLPGECVLYFSASDVVKQTLFIDEKTDPNEQRIAREQLQQMVHYAEINECRRAALLDYFSEEYPETNCGGCDNCLSPRATFDGTLAAQKLLSCAYRVKQHRGFALGLNHLVGVLMGADTEAIRKWGHKELSTYGIGQEHTRNEWGSIGRELIRLGYLRQDTGKFPVIELTPEGLAALKDRRKITLTRPQESPRIRVERVGSMACDEVLFEKLRILRKEIADKNGVPPYVVFSDVSLRQMARDYPTERDEFRRISGVGDRKLENYGAEFLHEIAEHLRTNPRQAFADDSFREPMERREKKGGLTNTVVETLQRFRLGQSVEHIASDRGFVVGTILGHLATAVETGEQLDRQRVFTDEDDRAIAMAFKQSGFGNLMGAFDSLGGRFTQGHLKLWRALATR